MNAKLKKARTEKKAKAKPAKSRASSREKKKNGAGKTGLKTKLQKKPGSLAVNARTSVKNTEKQTKSTPDKIERLGIIAGSGGLPQKAVNEAILGNMDFRVYAIAEEEIRPLYDRNGSEVSATKVYLARFNEILRQVENDNITHLIIAGKVHKKTFIRGIRFNLQTLRLLKKIRDNNDRSLFELVISEFEGIGIRVLAQDVFFKSLLLPPGTYSRIKPSPEQLEDIRYGMEFARNVAALDIGQSVVVANKTLLAVEAAEGTDAAIERGGEMARGKGVVCKAMRKKQDTRLDVPAVGLQTLEVMRRSGCKTLAIDAGHTFVLDKDEFIKKINDYRMIFVSVES